MRVKMTQLSEEQWLEHTNPILKKYNQRDLFHRNWTFITIGHKPST